MQKGNKTSAIKYADVTTFVVERVEVQIGKMAGDFSVDGDDMEVIDSFNAIIIIFTIIIIIFIQQSRKILQSGD